MNEPDGLLGILAECGLVVGKEGQETTEAQYAAAKRFAKDLGIETSAFDMLRRLQRDGDFQRLIYVTYVVDQIRRAQYMIANNKWPEKPNG